MILPALRRDSGEVLSFCKKNEKNPEKTRQPAYRPSEKETRIRHSGHKSAIHAQHLAGDKGSLLRAEEKDRLGHLPGRSKP